MTVELRAPVVEQLERLTADLALGRHGDPYMAFVVLVHPDTAPKRLDGLSGPDGAALLDKIIRGIEADRPKYEAMNPDNGWGDCDSFVKVLTEMRDAVPERPTTWHVSG